jgi:hypothetical protein
MKRIIIALLFCISTPLYAQNFPHRVGHYIRTHREQFIADAAIVLAHSSDAESSIYCGRYNGAYEINPILGPHPSAATYWGVELGTAAGLIGLNHFIYHRWEGTKKEHLIWVVVAPSVTIGIVDTAQNIHTIHVIQNYPKSSIR